MNLLFCCVFYQSTAQHLKTQKNFTKYHRFITKANFICKYYNQDIIAHHICRVGGNTMIFNVLTQAGLPSSKRSKVAGDRVKFFWELQNGNDETCYSLLRKGENEKKISFHQKQILQHRRERQEG